MKKFGHHLIILALAGAAFASCGDDPKTHRNDQEPRVVFNVSDEHDCKARGDGYRWEHDQCIYDSTRGSGRKL